MGLSDDDAGIAWPASDAYNQGMPAITILFGAALIALGVGGYLLTGRESWTALIPAIAGALLLICGLIGRAPSARKHAMHAAAALATLGVLGTIGGLIKALRWIGSGIAPERPTAVTVQAIMAVALLAYVGLAVRSFISARRSRGASDN